MEKTNSSEAKLCMNRRRRKVLSVLLILLCFCASAFAQKAQLGYRIDRTRLPLALTGEEEASALPRLAQPHSGYSSNAVGPGLFLMQSYYDYGSNGGVLTNLERNDDGTMAIGRMAATDPGTNDRGTYFTYFDGYYWSYMTKVEQFRRGWSNIAALSDFRNVVAAHSAAADIIGNEVNVDVFPGIGIWFPSQTGWATGTRAVWPRLTVDGANTIIVCMTTDGNVAGVDRSKEIAISRDEGYSWTNQILLPDTSARVPQFNADDQAIDSHGTQVAIAVAETFGDVHLWESTNSGASWNYRNLTRYPLDIPVGEIQNRPYGSCEVIYDNGGTLHIFWEALLATQDSAGTELDFFENREVGIQHWSEATGVNQVVAWSNLPNAELESDADLFRAGGTFNQVNADAVLTMQPQAGVDKDGNLYLLFAALRPLDYDAIDSTHYTDVYALGSADGGATWGEVVNITDTPQSEDLWASLADEVDDSLRFVYQSDGETGNSIQGGGAAPTNLLYYAFAKSRIPLQSVAQIAIATADTLIGFPDAVVEVPIRLALESNHVSALGAALKATNRNLIYEGFTPGPILPPNATFSVQALATDSVRFAFADFGSGPITQDGLLATLHFRVDKNAFAGSVSELRFSELSASNDNLQTVRVRSNIGRVNIQVRDAMIAIPDTLIGAPGDTVAVPVYLTVANNEISALGAALKTSGGILQFVRFTPGDIIPGASFFVNAPAADSVRLAYVDFGGGPLVRDGVLTNLYFVIAKTAQEGAGADLNFSGVSAARANYENLPIQSQSGKLTVKILAGKISGVLFEDVNGNGQREANEPVLAGRSVKLTGGGVTRADTTDTFGSFSFANVAPNRYQLTQVLPSKWVQSFPQQVAHEFEIAAGADLNFDFGSWQYATLTGSVWYDVNANKKRDDDEPGINKWLLELRGVLPGGQTLVQTLLTNRLGQYRFQQLAPGQYQVTQRLPQFWQQSFPSTNAYSAVLTSGLTRDSLDFGAYDTRYDAEGARKPNLAEGFSAIPESFVLSQNYPNPFNPSTKIYFGLPKETHARLEIFDMMGKRVVKLLDGLLPPGYHEIQFDASTLAGGLYWYQLTTPETVLRKKMMYLR